MQVAAQYNTAYEKDGVPWIAADFMGTGDRQKRIIDGKRTAEQKAKDKRDEDFLNFKLSTISQKKGSKSGVPFWALETWDGVQGTITKDQLRAYSGSGR